MTLSQSNPAPFGYVVSDAHIAVTFASALAGVVCDAGYVPAFAPDALGRVLTVRACDLRYADVYVDSGRVYVNAWQEWSPIMNDRVKRQGSLMADETVVIWRPFGIRVR